MSSASRTAIPENHGTAVYRAHGAKQHELCVVEATAGSGGGSEADLPGRHSRRGRAATG